MNKKRSNLLFSSIAIATGLLGGVVLMLITGHNPLNLFAALIRGTLGISFTNPNNFYNARYVGELFVTAMPITLTGLAVAFSFRVGLFNIGAEGQLLMGSWAAISAGLLFSSLPAVFLLPLVIIFGTAAGAFWGFIPGILKARFNIHEVVVTIMLNYAALYFTNFAYLLLPTAGNNVRTEPVGMAADLKSEFFASITNNSRLHWGIVILVLSVILYWYIMERTTFGYELRATGFNLHAARYAGIQVTRNITSSMMISGGFAGLAGVLIAVGTFNYGRVLPGFENYGFDGIAVALIGSNTAPGVLFAGFLFASLKSAQPIMQTRGVPRDIINIIIAIVILMIAMQHGVRLFLAYLEKRKKKQSDASNGSSLEAGNE